MIESSFTKHQALIQAADTFFAKTEPFDKSNNDDVKALLAVYQSALQTRNNIAHGTTVCYTLKDGSNSGYFLCRPSYASKKVRRLSQKTVYLDAASYFYLAKDLKYYYGKFIDMLDEAVRLAHFLNDKYKIVPPGELHP
ncbi:MAG: hypothetical protein ACLPWS_18070 [Rhodomicrobium sp.]